MNREPKAFENISKVPSYWNSNGKYQSLSERLTKLIPDSGEVRDAYVNKALERFRKASNCYYDLYNNGLCNRASEFYSVFGLSGFKATAEEIEAKLDSIILKAGKEQKMSVIPSVKELTETLEIAQLEANKANAELAKVRAELEAAKAR